MLPSLDVSRLVEAIIVVLGGGGIGVLVVRHIAKGTVDTFFAMQLKNHEAELAGVAAAARFDYSRRLADFKTNKANRRALRPLDIAARDPCVR